MSCFGIFWQTATGPITTLINATRIAIDCTPACQQSGGIGRYVRELIAALPALDQTTSYRLFVSGASRPMPLPPVANFIWKPTPIPPRWLARVWHRARMPIPIEVFTGQIDLFHATDFVLPPTLPSTRTLLTVHDLSFVRVPQAASPPLRAYLNRVVPRSVKMADHILADSQATKDDLQELYDTAADKITVLYSGVSNHFQPVTDEALLERVKAKYRLTGIDYLLSVGTVQPRKNYSRVIRALASLRQQGCDLHYAIAGGKGWLEDEMRQTIAETKLGDAVHLLGFVDDDDLPALYSAARMLVIPSLYEGFGLPILEAMACGVPVIASNLSSLPEIVGKAGILVDPLDIDAIGDAILRIESDSRRRAFLIDAGRRQAKQFTWEKSARRLKSIYEGLLRA